MKKGFPSQKVEELQTLLIKLAVISFERLWERLHVFSIHTEKWYLPQELIYS